MTEAEAESESDSAARSEHDTNHRHDLQEEKASNATTPKSKAKLKDKDGKYSSPPASQKSKNRSRRKNKSTRKSNNKENKNDNNDSWLVGWRETEQTACAPKTNGIPPRSFHKGKNRRRSRPGYEEVEALNILDKTVREETKRLSREQEIRRSVFKKLTSLHSWPLQDLAMKDLKRLRDEHFQRHSSSDGKDSNGSSDVTQPKPEHTYGDTSSSGSDHPESKRQLNDINLSPSKIQQKIRFQKEFEREKNLPANLDAKSTEDPANRFDSGLWSMEPRIFASEKANGKRKYLVGHLGRFMDLSWRKTDRCNRHFYELILEKKPCRLYFDLEYSIPENPDIPAETLMDEFFEQLAMELKSVFPDDSEDFDRTCVVDLDSSTPQKFSRHWIVHLPSLALFRDSQHAGKFVKRFIQRLADGVATEQLKEHYPVIQEYLFVNPKGSNKNKGKPNQKSCFVDLGVYTRNRLFRLMGSSKFGKSPECALRIAEANQFSFPEGFGNELFYVPAMATVKSERTKDEEDDDDEEDKENKEEQDNFNVALEKFKSLTDWTPHAKALSSTLVVPINATKIIYPLLPEMTADSENSGGQSKNMSQYLRPSTNLPEGDRSSSTARQLYSYGGPSFGSSPYPYIDEFVTDVLATRGGIRGSIRTWAMDYGPPADVNNENKSYISPLGITYQMSRNRWCECVGRFHKSNNIMWKVDFLTKQCIQSCLDPECRAMNFRGTPVDLPDTVVQLLDDALFEEQIAHMDDTDFVQNCTAVTSAKDIHGHQNDYGFASADDEEFEKALMALNLGESEVVPPTTTIAKQEINESPVQDEFPLSDDALLDALLTNPEMFP